MNDIRENAGYFITDSVKLHDIEIVIGSKPSTIFGVQYVTWLCRHENDYFFGHYFSDEWSAKEDFINRVNNELEFFEVKVR